jgi:hypothetical protein
VPTTIQDSRFQIPDSPRPRRAVSSEKIAALPPGCAEGSPKEKGKIKNQKAKSKKAQPKKHKPTRPKRAF